MSQRDTTSIASVMIAVSVIGSVISMVISILFARVLGPVGFQEFAVATATLALAGTFCEFGTGKYAMRIMPQFTQQKNWALAVGFVWYSGIIVLVASLGGAVIGYWSFGGFEIGSAWNSQSLAFVFLPTTVLVAVCAELIMANQKAILGSSIMRLVCPIATLSLFGLAALVGFQLKSTTAVFCFGGGGFVGLLVAIAAYRKSAPPEMFQAYPEFEWLNWTRYCLWFLGLSFMTSWIMKLSLLVLKAEQIPEIEIAQFAAALEVSCLVLLIAKSTNKFYQPQLSLILADSNWDLQEVIQRERLTLIISICLAFLAVVVLFGKTILGWFGDEFVNGYTALCFMTVGTCTATVFAMAPEYLKFTDRLKTVLAIYSIAGVALIVLTWVLAAKYGVSGAGFAFGIVFVLATIAFRVIAVRQMAMLTDSA